MVYIHIRFPTDRNHYFESADSRLTRTTILILYVCYTASGRLHTPTDSLCVVCWVGGMIGYADRFLEFGYLIRYTKAGSGTWTSLFFYFLCASCALFGYYFFVNVPEHTDELGTIVCAQFAGLLLFYTFIINSTQSFVSIHDFFAVGDGSAAARFMTGLERAEEHELRAICAGKIHAYTTVLRTKDKCCGAGSESNARQLMAANGGLTPFAEFAATVKTPQPAIPTGCWDEFWSSSDLWALRFVLGSKHFMHDREDSKISDLFSTCSMIGVLFPLLLQIIITILKLFLGDDWKIDS